MTKRKNFSLVLVAMALLSSCGFQPLHSQAYRESLSVNLASFSITVVGNNITPEATSVLSARYAELLKAEIADQTNPLNDRQEKLFDLAITFTEYDTPVFVNPDGTASRGDLVYNSNYTITRRSDSKLVASGMILRTSSYNTSPTADYASYVSIQDARKRGIVELGEDYKLRLAALLPTLNNPEGSAIAVPVVAPSNELQPSRNREIIRP